MVVFRAIPVRLAVGLIASLLVWSELQLKVDSFNCGRFLSRCASTRLPVVTSASLEHGGTSNSTVQDTEDRRQQSLQLGNHPLISLNLNLDSMAESGAATRAQELLQRIHALYEEGYYQASPDTVSYNSVLKAWKEDNNPTKAFELLQEMIIAEDENVRADVISFNTVALAFAKTGNYPQAEYLLREMKQRDHLPNPDTITYNAVLYAFAQSQDQGVEAQAEELLKEMIASNVMADSTSFNTVMLCFCNRNKPYHAEKLLDHMETLAAAGNSNVLPDVISYTTCIQAWTKNGKPLKAQAVLDKMIQQGLEPNRYTYTVLMSSLAKAGEPEKAEAILNDMVEAYSEGKLEMKPDTVAFSTVVDGWAKLSSVDSPFAADRAMLLLQRMQEYAVEGVPGIKPNAITYTSVLTALGKSGRWEACEQAHDLLFDMESACKSGDSSVRPTTIHYNACLHAYARSPRADKAIKAFTFFRMMEKNAKPHCRPDIISYNSLLMACANAFGDDDLKKKSFEIAVYAFKAAVQSKDPRLRPTSTTFAHFCKATRRLVPTNDQKFSILRKALRLCCDEGMLNPVVVQQVQMACQTEKDWRDTAAGLSLHIGLKGTLQEKSRTIPQQWVCNARR